MTTTTDAVPLIRQPIISAPDILTRIEGAKERLRDGHALMRVPVDPTDPDCVLADAELEIKRLRALLASKPAMPMGSIATMQNLVDTWDIYVGNGRSEPDALIFVQSMNRVRELLDNTLGNTASINAEMIRRLRALQRNSIRPADLNADATLSEVIAMLAASPAAPSLEQDERGALQTQIDVLTALREGDSLGMQSLIKERDQLWRELQNFQEATTTLVSEMMDAMLAEKSWGECLSLHARVNAILTAKHARAASTSANVAQGAEAIYEAMATDDDENHPNLWMEVDLQSFEVMKKRPDIRTRIVYAAPPAQTQVALTEVGFIVQDDVHGWHFAPTVAWTYLGKGRALYALTAAQPASEGE